MKKHFGKANVWIITGLIWGIFMYVTMTFINPSLEGEPITKGKIIISIPIWLIAGLVYGYLMKIVMRKRDS